MPSDCQRRVLEATAALPYGADTSYAGIAARIGAPSAVRPVAQALRWNPLPIVIPCHRVIGGARAPPRYPGPRLGPQQPPVPGEGAETGAGREDFNVEREALCTIDTCDSEYSPPTRA